MSSSSGSNYSLESSSSSDEEVEVEVEVEEEVEEEEEDPYGYISGESISGFFTKNCDWFPLFMSENRENFLGPVLADDVFSSEKGLILVNYRFNDSYAVVNPFIFQATKDIPSRVHSDAVQRVLVVPSDTAFYIVCAVPADDNKYRFDIYSSVADTWEAKPVHDFRATLVEESGVSCGTKAYWLLTNKCKIAYYDVVDDSKGSIYLPVPNPRRVQLGRSGSQLSVAMNLEACPSIYAHVYTLETLANGWVHNELDSYEEGQEVPKITRFQGAKLQVPLLINEELRLLETAWNSSTRVRLTGLLEVQPDYEEVIMPYVYSDINPNPLPNW